MITQFLRIILGLVGEFISCMSAHKEVCMEGQMAWLAAAVQLRRTTLTRTSHDPLGGHCQLDLVPQKKKDKREKKQGREAPVV